MRVYIESLLKSSIYEFIQIPIYESEISERLEQPGVAVGKIVMTIFRSIIIDIVT